MHLRLSPPPTVRADLAQTLRVHVYCMSMCISMGQQAETLRALEDTVGRLRSEHGHERRAREASEAHILQLLRDAITHQSHLQRSLLE